MIEKIPSNIGYTCKDTEAEVIAFMALMKMEEADNGLLYRPGSGA